MSETWLPAVGYEGYYEVSDLGNVRSIDRIVYRKDGGEERRRGTPMSPKTERGRGGYRRVSLRKSGIRLTHTVHSLVLSAFVGPRPDGMQIDHIDNDPGNNRLENLQYVNAAENTNRQKLFGTSVSDRANRGIHHQVIKTHCPRGHELKDPNLVISQKIKGGRSCRACARARSYVQRHPDQKQEFNTISDHYYTQIVKETVNV